MEPRCPHAPRICREIRTSDEFMASLRWSSPTVLVVVDQSLIEHGPYERLRHPSYTGTLLTLIGVSVALGSLLSGFLVLIAVGRGDWFRH